MINISKKFRNILVLAGFITLLALLIGDIYYGKNEHEFKKISKNIYIENNTDYDIEFKTKLILNSILHIDSVFIKYEYMDEPRFIDGHKVGAYVVKNKFFDNQYNISLSKTLKLYHVDIIIAHELIHVQQHESFDLEIISRNLGIYIYKGDTIDTYFVPYLSRGYEIDAYEREDSVYNKLHLLLDDCAN